MVPGPYVISILPLFSAPERFSVPPPSALLAAPGLSFEISPIAVAEALRAPARAPLVHRRSPGADELADPPDPKGEPRRGRERARKPGTDAPRPAGRARGPLIGSMMAFAPPLIPVPTVQHGRFVPAPQSTLDPLRTGQHLAPAIERAVLPHVDVGVASLFGHARGFEPTVLLSTRLGPLRPSFNLGMPVVDIDHWRYGVAGATTLTWEIPRRLDVFAEVGGVQYESVPRGYQKKSLVPSAGLRGHF